MSRVTVACGQCSSSFTAEAATGAEAMQLIAQWEKSHPLRRRPVERVRFI